MLRDTIVIGPLTVGHSPLLHRLHHLIEDRDVAGDRHQRLHLLLIRALHDGAHRGKDRSRLVVRRITQDGTSTHRSTWERNSTDRLAHSSAGLGEEGLIVHGSHHRDDL